MSRLNPGKPGLPGQGRERAKFIPMVQPLLVGCHSTHQSHPDSNLGERRTYHGGGDLVPLLDTRFHDPYQPRAGLSVTAIPETIFGTACYWILGDFWRFLDTRRFV
ncbi:uncharacterized protein LOC144136467 isoform X2 [Amblyomma americanum]